MFPGPRRRRDKDAIFRQGSKAVIYRPDEPQGSLKDFEFSRPTMEMRWQQGLADARTTLQASPWLAPMPGELAVRAFDVIHDILMRDAKLAETPPSESAVPAR
jgi:hypothetical protein